MQLITARGALGSRKGFWRKAFGVTAAFCIANALLVPSAPAGAVGVRPYAAMGPGYGQPGVGAGELGAFRAESDGALVYCIDAGASSPTGSVTGAPRLVTSLADRNGHQATPDELARWNAIYTTHGAHPSSNDEAAATALYAWSVFDPTTYNSHGMSGDDWFITRAPASARPAIRADLAQFRTEAAAISAAPASGSASLSIRMGSSYDGQVTVSANPANATGTLKLAGAHVAGSSATTATVQNGSVVQITGTPKDDQVSYQISADAHFTGSGGYAGNVNLYETPGKQRLIGAGTPGQSSFDAQRTVSDPLSTVFSPVVTTKVASKFVKPGESFVDGLTASVAKGSQKWRQSSNGEYRPIVAKGTLYGPFITPPTAAATAPAGAPVVGTDTVTLDKGPGAYKSSGKLKADEAGYYTWVWTIRAGDQDDRTQTQIPKNYAFTDQFGQVTETHVSPSAITATSHVDQAEVPLSGALVDGIDVAVKDGAWIRDTTGARVPVTFTGTAYHVPGVEAPAVSDTVPADAVVLGERKLTASKPGTYTTAADPIEAPAATGGSVSWVWQVRTQDQPAKWQGYVQDWADSFGLPNETVHIAVPQVSSLAKADVALGAPATDTGIIAGTMPAKPATLTFEAYRQPQADDRFPQPRTASSNGTDGAAADGSDDSTTTEPTAPQGVCTAGNRVFTTNDAPITVTETGEHESAPATFTRYGSYYWVETLRAHTGEVIARGACGAVGETTTVAPFTVTTTATPTTDAGGDAHDTLHLTGPVPDGVTATFTAYQQDESGQDICLADNQIDTTDPITVPATDQKATRPRSAETIRADVPGPDLQLPKGGRVHWVETLRLADGTIHHVGDCGADGETTTVTPPPVTPPVPPVKAVPPAPKVLAFTGAQLPTLWIGGGAVVAAAIGLVLIGIRRRRTTSTAEPDAGMGVSVETRLED